MGRARGNTKQEPEQIARFDLRLPASQLEAMEQVAEQQHRSTSAQFRLVIARYLAEPEPEPTPLREAS